MRFWGVAAAIGLTLAGSAARAEQGLGTKVYEPYVKAGVTELEISGGRLNGGALAGEGGGLIEVEHGFSDRFSLALVGELEHHAGERSKLDSVGVEGVAYLGQIPGLGIDVGAYLEYEQRIHNESGVIEGKLLFAKQFGEVSTLVNLIATRPLTSRSDERETDFSYAAQLTIAIAYHLRAGVQAFGDLGSDRGFGGRQAHYLGPMLNWEIRPAWAKGEIELQAAYLLPVGSASQRADSQVRFLIEYEHRF